MNTSQSSDNSLQRSPLDKIESAVRDVWKGGIRALYRFWAGKYETTMISRFGYQAPEFIARALAPLMPEGSARVLDVGCGTGLTALALLEHRTDTIDGIDFSPEMLEKARDRGIYADLHTADVTKPLPIPNGTYDAAISSGLFTHGHVGAEAIPHVLKAIKAGGLFGFTVYWKVWERAGFAAMLENLEKAGTIEILVNEQESHMRAIEHQKIHTVVVRHNG